MLFARERELVCGYARQLVHDRLVVGTAGNISARVESHVVVTPSGIDYDALRPEAVCVVDLEGEPVEEGPEPSRELPLHLAVYRATDAGAVVHTHSPHATALATAADELPAIHYLVAELGGPVRVAPYATPGSDRLAGYVVSALADRTAALLRNHGAITVGSSLERAYARSVTLEWLAALYGRARLLGTPSVLPDDEVERLLDVVRSYGRTPHSGGPRWTWGKRRSRLAPPPTTEEAPMYARVASFESGDSSNYDELVRTVEQRMQGDPPHPAMKGGMMLVDREGGRSLGITFFDSREAIQEAEPMFERMGDEIPEELRGRRIGVDVYEVALERRL